MSQTEAAGLIGISHVALGNIERRDSLPSMVTLYAAVKVYAVSFQKLLPYPTW